MPLAADSQVREKSNGNAPFEYVFDHNWKYERKFKKQNYDIKEKLFKS